MKLLQTILDELTETATSYISFCEDMCIPTRTPLTYNNDKPWFTAKLRQLLQAKEDAYRNGDRVLYKQVKYTLEKEIRVAKRNYSDNLKIQLSSSDTASVWKGLKDLQDNIPQHCGKSTTGRQSELQFYCRFEKKKNIHTSSNPPLPHTCNSDKRRKAPGPDSVTPACLKSCADQLAPIFTQIFNRSLELCEVPSCFKRSTIIPILKKPKITGLTFTFSHLADAFIQSDLQLGST